MRKRDLILVTCGFLVSISSGLDGVGAAADAVGSKKYWRRGGVTSGRGIFHRPPQQSTFLLPPERYSPKAPSYSLLNRWRGGEVVSSTSSFGQTLVPPVVSSLVRMTAPALVLSSTVWLVLAMDIRRHMVLVTKSAKKNAHRHPPTVDDGMVQTLRTHRRQKIQSLRQTLSPALVTLMASCLVSRSWPWEPKVWENGPPAWSVGLNLAFWASEITMDTALDECQSLSLQVTTVFSGLLQLILILYLTTSPRGHAIFLFKAMETILATALARVIDHFYWLVIAAVTTLALVTAGLRGYLATPAITAPEVATSAAMAYFGATLLGSTLYQLVQNVAHVRIRHVQGLRAALVCAAMMGAHTPPSWILYDVMNFALFFVFKVVTDTVALQALASTGR